MLDSEKVATIATQDHDGISLRERILCGQEMPCCDCKTAESQQCAQQQRYSDNDATLGTQQKFSPAPPLLSSPAPFGSPVPARPPPSHGPECPW